MHESFRIRDLETLHTEADRLGLELPVQEDVDPLFSEVKLGSGHVLANRLAVQPMEGADAEKDGRPGLLTSRRYRRYAAGGASLICFEACAVVEEGRSNPRQLWIQEGNLSFFESLVRETRKAAQTVDGLSRPIVLILQLTHSGRYAKPEGLPAPMIVHHSPELDRRQNIPPDYPLVSDEYLDRLQDSFLNAARLAAQAGFDGVDIKSCHGYLVSGLLAAHTRGQSRYGGSFDNRIRFLTETLSRIKNGVPGIFITTRLGVYDPLPYPFGFGVSCEDRMVPDLKESLDLVRELKKIGIPIFNHSIGNPHVEPHFGRPFDIPDKGSPIPDEHPLKGVARFLSITAKMQKAEPELPMIGAGYSWLRRFWPHVAAASIACGGASIVGLGRSAFAYPDAVRDLEKNGKLDPSKTCTACSACSTLLRSGGPAGCTVRDGKIYVLP